MRLDESSMLLWYPKIKDLDIPQPKTEMLELEGLAGWGYPEERLGRDYPKIKSVARKIGYPLFVRTDLASGKHDWERSCYVADETRLGANIRGVLEFNYCADVVGLQCRALVFREFIKMASAFTAFWGKMPVNPERRYFIKDGGILCHHHYWIEDAIRNPSIENWKPVLKKLNTETPEEVSLLTSHAEKVGKVLKGYWSVDFCKGANGVWYLIDLAKGDISWHEESCPFKKREMEKE